MQQGIDPPPPAPKMRAPGDDMHAIRTRSVSANGLSFAVDEAGEGDTVALLLHGFPECRQTWHGQLPALAKLGWRVVAPDLRGYGETSRPRARQAYHLDRLVDDVEALFEALGARRRILMGHDWGGLIAWEAAIRDRAGLDGLVILNAPHRAVLRRVAKTFEQRSRSWYVLLFLLPLLPELQLTAGRGAKLKESLRKICPAFSEAFLDTLARNIVLPGACTAMLDYYRVNALGFTSSAWPDPKPMLTPTLVIWGDNDAFLSRRLTEGNEAYVRDFTLRRLPDIGHWVQHEAPDQMNALIADWAQAKGLTGEGSV
jgi:pimeloyl-ACP methyl ester carboxylesterase